MNRTYHIAARTYQEYETKLQDLIDSEDPGLCCANIAWLPCGENEESAPEKVDAGKLADDIEEYYQKGKGDLKSIAERVSKLEIYHAYKELKVFGTEIEEIPDTPDEILKLLLTKDASGPKLCKYVEGLGMDIFDMERKEKYA